MKPLVEIIENPLQLEAVREDWRRLDGGVPFCTFDWLSAWWRHYGRESGHPRLQLHVLVVRDLLQSPDQQVMAIAPWYAQRTRTRGTVLQQLGGGEVCSDHVSVLCDSRHYQLAADAIASHLEAADNWDRLELEHLDQDDPLTECLAERLNHHHCAAALRPTGNTWSIRLPASWDEFLAMQSKSHRKQLRRAAGRVLATDRAKWHPVENDAQFDFAWPTLVDLHQRRRRSLGQPGCFASEAFARFHYEVARQLLATGTLRLGWLELDGAPVAAEYQLAGDGTTYAYQGGVDPSRLDDGPGRLSTIATLQAAIAAGHTTFDFLRGDEPYKAHWRAEPRATCCLRGYPPSHSSNWLAQTADWADSVASAVKAGLRPLVSPGLPSS